MGNALKTRLERLEGAVDPRGLLPTIIVVPADGPDRAAALADVQRLRRQGLTVIEIADDADRLNGVVDWLETLI